MIAADADAESVGHLTREVATFRGELIQSWQRSMRQRIDVEQIWRHAVEEAVLKLSTYRGGGTAFDAGEMIGRLGSVNPFGIDELRGETFKFHALVERLRAHLAPEGSL